jgi:prepilin-type processing-associated H-X9-DG protein
VKINNYGKAASTTLAGYQLPGSTVSAPAGAPTNVAFPNAPMSMVNDNVDAASLGIGLNASVAYSGAMSHDIGGERDFNLGFADGHVVTVKTTKALGRKGGSYAADMDVLSALEILAAGQEFPGGNPNANQWQNLYNSAPYLAN